MKYRHNMSSIAPGLVTVSLVWLTAIVPAYAQQDSEFIDCARFSDRAERIACLEDALEAATDEAPMAAEPAAPEQERGRAPVVDAIPAIPPRPVAETPAAPVNQPVTADSRIEDFGQPAARLSQNERGDVLHDTISALEGQNGMWRVTLSSGQIWEQQYPKTYNLRVGDEVTIERGGFGNGFRMSADRLSGFIRVSRTDTN